MFYFRLRMHVRRGVLFGFVLLIFLLKRSVRHRVQTATAPYTRKHSLSTLCLKKRRTFGLLCEPILTTFGSNITEKLSDRKVLYFPTSPIITDDSALSGKTRKHENDIFSLIVVVLPPAD